MKLYKFLLWSILLFYGTERLMARPITNDPRIRTVSEYNVVNKKKVLDHLTRFTADGLIIEEIEYYSNGMVKSRTLYEYDSQKRCLKTNKYDQKGKLKKVIIFGYDNSDQKILESDFYPERRTRSDRVFEYTWH